MPDYPKVPQQISDPISENLAKLAELFPVAVKDGALDVEALRAELGDFEEIKPGDETYELNWVGKRAAKKETFKPLLGKTMSLKDDGKDSNTTQNIFIEGDNLEALKLLRQNYFGEIRMIYIDPPYNTGSDLVYTDKFSASFEDSDEEEGRITNEGKRLIKNEKTSNRYHARWLDMMYQRIKLAKDLMSPDGVIFISIDDNEVTNLRQICNEIFGENNFVTCFSWHKGKEGGNDSTVMRSHFEYILLYAKDSGRSDLIRLDPKDTSRHRTSENEPNLVAGIISEPRKGEQYQLINLTKQKDYNVKIPLTTGETIESPSYSPQKSIDEWIKTGKIFVGSKKVPYVKSYFTDELQGQKPSNILESSVGTTKSGSIEIRTLLGDKNIFSYPKPSSLIKRLIFLGSKPDSQILDFFSGSATTAHAVMQLNAEDGGRRKYIMVQLPEVCDDASEAAKAGYKTIAEIGKERIRRAGEIIKEELKSKHEEWKKKQALDSKKSSKLGLDDEAPEETNPYTIDPDTLDIGFKSFRIEDTKINWLKKDLRGEQLEFSDTTTQDALDFVPGYTDTDVVYELMLRQSNILSWPPKSGH